MARIVFPCCLERWLSVKDKLHELKETSKQDDCDLPTLAELHQAVYNLNIGLDNTDDIQYGNTLLYGLVKFLRKHASPEERTEFLKDTLPSIIDLAVQIEDLLPMDGIVINQQQHAETVSIERRLCVSILACAFLCLFPGEYRGHGEKLNVINFNNFFANLPIPSQNAKLRCILNFFTRVSREWKRLTGSVTFTRQVLKPEVLPTLDTWLNCTSDLCPVIFHPTGVMEDAGCGAIEVDFANRFIGGGVLGRGRVQEQIRFTVCPELIVSLLFMEVMEENEAIVIQGFEQFSATEGYEAGLQFAGDYVDPAEMDEAGDLRHMLCAIDAMSYRNDRGDGLSRQYTDHYILRDLNKAYAGFCTEFKVPSNMEFLRLQSEEEYFTADESESEENGLEPSRKFRINLFVEDVISQAISIAIPEAVSHISCLPSNVNIEHVNEPTHEDGELEDSFQSQSTTNSIEEEPTMNHLEVNFRDWLAHYRRRSSNLSDVSSRRSSYDSRRSSYDYASRRSSGSRMSTDFSSEFEEYFENFQHQEQEYKFHTIKEEVGGSMVNEFAANLALSLLQAGTNAAAHADMDLQMFHGEQPQNVLLTKPQAIKVRDLRSVNETVIRQFVDRMFSHVWPFLSDSSDCDSAEKRTLRCEIDSYLYPAYHIPHVASDVDTIESHVMSDDESDISEVGLAETETLDESQEVADRLVAKAFDEALVECKYECMATNRKFQLSRESSQSEHSTDSRSQLDLLSSPNLHNTDQSNLSNKVDLHNCDKTTAAVAQHMMLEIFKSVSDSTGTIESADAAMSTDDMNIVPSTCDTSFPTAGDVDNTGTIESADAAKSADDITIVPSTCDTSFPTAGDVDRTETIESADAAKSADDITIVPSTCDTSFPTAGDVDRTETIESADAAQSADDINIVPSTCDTSYPTAGDVEMAQSEVTDILLQGAFSIGAINSCKLVEQTSDQSQFIEMPCDQSCDDATDKSKSTACLSTRASQSNSDSNNLNSSRSYSLKDITNFVDAKNSNSCPASSQILMKLPQSSNSCMSSSVENTALHLVDNKLLKGSPSISPKKQLSSESDPDNKAISSSNSNSNNSAGSELAASMQTKSLHKSSTSLEKVNKPNSSPRSNCHPKNGRCVAGHKNIKENFDQFAKCLSRDLLTHAFLDVQDSGDTVIFSRRSSEPIQISNGPALQRLENSNPTINGKRTQKSKTDEDIGKFAEELNHHGATCEVEEDYRRVSSGFRDPVLSRFAIELMKTNVSVPTLKLPNGAVSTSSSTSMSVCSTVSSFRDPLLSNFESELLSSSLGKSSAKTQMSWSKMKLNSYSPRRSNSLGLPRLSRGSDRSARRFNSLSFDSEHSAVSWKSIGSIPVVIRPMNMSEFADSLSQRIIQEAMIVLSRRISGDINNRALRDRANRNMTFDEYCNMLAANIIKSAMAEVKVRKVCSDWLEQNKMVTWSNETERLVYSGEESCDSDVGSSVSETNQSDRSQDRISSIEYEDALDVPYGRLEEFADMMAGRVLVHSVAMYRQEKESVLRRQYGRPISTGNWGCGAFGGDPHLKSLLQWMAASYAGTPYMAYYSFNNAKMTRFQDVVETIQSRGWNVSSLMQAIRRYCIMAGEQIEQHGHLSQCHDLFDVIIQSNFPGL